MSRYKLTIEYNGTTLIGWQINAQGPSVQSLLQDAIFKFSGQKTEVYAAGRTDAGVHAYAMVAHVDIDESKKQYGADTVMMAMNFYLKNLPVVILKCELVSDDFHARFSCLGRKYRYIIMNRNTPTILNRDLVWWIPRPLDVNAMHMATEKLIGNHDFTSFRASECQSKSPIKTIDSIDINISDSINGAPDIMDKYIIIDIAARSFLHHQVRNIVGTLVEIGYGKPYDIDKVLAARDRSAAGPTAPAMGLYFVAAKY